MKQELNVRLVISEKMDRDGQREDGVIRLPRPFRETYPKTGKTVTIKTTKNAISLTTKRAWAADISKQLKRKQKRTISKKQLYRTAFVNTKTFGQLVGDSRKKSFEECYISTNIEKLMIGADPEFGLIDPVSGKLLYASHTGALAKAGELGHDGPLAEVRPSPHKTINDIIVNIRDIFKRGQATIDNYGWVGGATYKNENNTQGRIYHLGGHIHIGNPVALPEECKEAAYRAIIHVLDEYIALPMVRIDGPEPHKRRNEKWNGYGMYGRWGDQRKQEGRFEWRVLSGLWLAHPDLARAVLGATKAVSEACYQSMSEKGFDTNWIKPENVDEGFLKHWNARKREEVEDLVNEALPGRVPKTMVNRSVKKLKNLPNYDKYKGEIDEFETLVNMSVRDKKNINLDLKDTWVNNGNLIKEK
jgi:hypothetical protein